MEAQRRDVLKAGAGIGLLALLAAAGVVQPGAAWAADGRKAFAAGNLAEALQALGAADATKNGSIRIEAPDIAENGAVVPLSISTALPGVSQIAILVEKNRNPLAASFTLPAGTEASFQTRIKMAENSRVVVLVKADDGFYLASREIQVTIGGCG